jgi:hypothetical protein
VRRAERVPAHARPDQVVGLGRIDAALHRPDPGSERRDHEQIRREAA